MTKTIYRIKEGTVLTDFEDLADYGFDAQPIFGAIIKQIDLPLDGDAAQFLRKQYYENPQWIEQIYKPNKKQFKQEYDLRYHKDGTMVMTPSMKKILTTWYLQIEVEDDGWVGFTSSDKNNIIVYYGSNVLDEYCSREIFLLMSKNLIEQVEVETDENGVAK